MKKALLFTVMLFAVLPLIAQNGISLTNTNGTVTVNTSQAILPVVQKTTVPGKSAAPDTSQRLVIWVEGGNDFFSTDPNDPVPLNGYLSHNTFLLSTRLYDTTKDLRIIYDAPATGTGRGANAHHDYLSNRGVKIIPNVYDIVPGDTMAFALAYQTLPENPAVNAPFPGDHKLYFFYNAEAAFLPVTSDAFLLPGPQIRYCRRHNGETPNFFSGIPPNLNINLEGGPYTHYIVFTIPNNSSSDYEKNLFVSLVANPTLVYGNSCSVLAVLTDSADNMLGSDIIPAMRFAPAHDPNYIVQSPVCSALPKKAQPFTYTVHFQNTGGGNAVEVKAEIFFPRGMDLRTFNPAQHIIAANFGGVNVKNTNKLDIKVETANNKMIVRFLDPGYSPGTMPSFVLKGTNTDNPATNPATMGEITFTLPSTADTDDSMKAWAEIYFLSQYPSSGNAGEYEKKVVTDTAITRYQKCCGPGCEEPDPNSGCKKFIGLCWWWWVIILLAIITLWFIIARRRRRRCRDEQPAQP